MKSQVQLVNLIAEDNASFDSSGSFVPPMWGMFWEPNVSVGILMIFL